MRFLIEVCDLRTPWRNKYTRVLEALLNELALHDGIAVKLSDRGGMARSKVLDEQSLDVSDKILGWRKPTAFSLARAAKVKASYVLCFAIKDYLPSKWKNGLAWNFAYSIEMFSAVWRRRVFRFLDLYHDAQRFTLLHHWLAERGFTPDNCVIARDNNPTEYIAVTDQDVLVLAGVSWRHDTDILRKLKETTGVRLVLLIYDLLPIDYSSIVTVSRRKLFERFLDEMGQIADLIVTPSTTTTSRLRAFYDERGIQQARIAFISILGASLKRSDGRLTRRLADAGLANTRFILCVSDLRERAHVLWLYALCTKLRQQRADFPLLVIAGHVAHPNVLEILTNDPAWGTSGIFIEDPRDEELSWLYRNTQLCLQPAFEGGAGMTIMEAIKYGRCIAADSRSLIDASRGRAMHLPRDETLWGDAICQMLEDAKPPASPDKGMDKDEASPGILTQIAALLEGAKLRPQ